MRNTRLTRGEAYAVVIGFATVMVMLVAGYVRHLAWTLSTLTASDAGIGQAALALIGAFIPPLGTLHGWAIIIGALPPT